MIDTFKVRRRCLIADQWREYGELVPEGHTWRIIESEVASGALERVQVSEADFEAAVQQYCPELAEEIYAREGLEPYVPGDEDTGTSGDEDPPGNGPGGDGPPGHDKPDKPDKPGKPRAARKAPVLTRPPESLEG